MAPLPLKCCATSKRILWDFQLNFDDTQKNPCCCPAGFPFAGQFAPGIAVGLAKHSAAHNFGEVIDGTIALMENPQMGTREMMRYIPAPDFPRAAYWRWDGGDRKRLRKPGAARCTCARAPTSKRATGRKRSWITEIPYQVNKAAMLEKILKLSEEKKALLAGIHDIRDESDRTGMRAVIEVKRDADVGRFWLGVV